MQRRGFLGMLASLPIIAGLKSIPEQEQYFHSTPIKRGDVDNETVDKMMRNKMIHGGSGTLCPNDIHFVACSGTFIV